MSSWTTAPTSLPPCRPSSPIWSWWTAAAASAAGTSARPWPCPGEEIVQTFQSVRDGVVFTTRRVIAVNVQGVTGMKKAFTILPYRRIQAYAIESAGLADLDGELQLWFSGLGTVRFELLAGSDLAALCQAIECGM